MSTSFDTAPCDDCDAPTTPGRRVYEVRVDAHRLTAGLVSRRCPRCACHYARRRKSGQVEDWARQATRHILERTFGEPVAIRWLQCDSHHWTVLARRARSHRCPSPRPESPAKNA
jgi:hypothetical protein